MEIHILLLFVTFSLATIQLFLNLHRNKNQPPGPIGLPIIGNLHQLGPKLHCSLSSLAKTYGPIISLRFGFVTVVVASSPATAQEILQKNDHSFANRPVPDSLTAQPNVNDTLSWAPADARWRNRRRICTTHIFTTQRLDLLQHLRHRKAQQLVQHLHKRASTRTMVDIGELTFATMLNLLANTVFSEDLVDSEFESAGEFKELAWRIMEDVGKVNLSDYFPVLKRLDLQGVKRHVKVSYVRLHEIFSDMIQRRVKDTESACGVKSNGDFLDLLLDHCEQGGGSVFTVESIKSLLVDLFIAGSDTSGSTTEWAMAELLHNPEVMQKARNELIQVIGTSNEVKESDIPKLPYIQAIVKETLRLHPPVPLLLPYVAGNDVEVSGYTIHRGNQVMINAWSIGRNPEFWDDPLTFQPERFLNSNIDFGGRNFEYLPFGSGRRICPGRPLAIRMISLMVAVLVHSFDWELPEGVTAETLDMSEQYGITLKKLTPLCAIPIALSV